MSKSYPHIDIKCNDCEVITLGVPIIYESDNDRWTRMATNPIAQYDPNYKGWKLSDGVTEPDYCPRCVEKRQTEQIPQPAEPISS
jgi:hypothetical protein